VTNRRKRKGRGTGSGYRDARPAPAPEPARRRGFLDQILSPRAATDSQMPKIRTSVARGFVTIVGLAAFVVGIEALLFVVWIVLVALGFQGPFASMVSALALPPLGTSFDATLATSIFGLQGGIFGITAFVLFRGIWVAWLTAAVVEALDTGRLTPATLASGLRALPVSLATSVLGVAFLTLSSFFAPLLGPGIGILIQVGGLILGVYLFVFAPVIAVAERRALPDCLTRSIRAARMPGVGNLGMAALYVIPAIAIIVAPGKPGNVIGVNPSAGAWVLVLVVNVLHAAMLAAFAFRYLAIADEVPAPAPRARAGDRRR
jgi:hypothetical protein